MFALIFASSSAWPPVVDPRRVNAPIVPFALEPLQWGAVEPRGWIREWAETLARGAASPTCAAFATLQKGAVDGWKNGRPSDGGFWDEDSAYWIDGIARLGLILHDDSLVARAKADFDHVLAHPFDFHNTFPGDAVEGWVRSIYSRGMLAYYDGTGDARVLAFLESAFANYTAADSTMHTDQQHQGSRSMTQMEALLETHAFGGDDALRDVALALTTSASPNNGSLVLAQISTPECANGGDADAIRAGRCDQHTHGVTFNEVMKCFAMGAPWEADAARRAMLLNASISAFEMVERRDMQPHGVNSADEVSVLLFTVTFYANLAHNLTRSP